MALKNVSGSFASCVHDVYQTDNGVTPPVVSPCSPASLSGTVDIVGTSVTSLNLSSSGFPDHLNDLGRTTLSNLSADGLSWTLNTRVIDGGVSGEDLHLVDTAGVLSNTMDTWSSPDLPLLYAWQDNWSNLSGSVVVTPLPGAVPLFATGLGALGLLGWRRRKGQTS